MTKIARAALGLLLAVQLLPAPPAQAVGAGHSGWTWGSPFPQGETINAIDFKGTRGYAAGQFGTVLRSDDAGLTWTGLVTGTTEDRDHLAMIGSDSVVIAGNCTVRRSDDGGGSFRRLAWTGSGLALGLIVLGGVVRITGSGMGCGDHWPRCDGEWFPPLDLPTLSPATVNQCIDHPTHQWIRNQSRSRIRVSAFHANEQRGCGNALAPQSRRFARQAGRYSNSRRSERYRVFVDVIERRDFDRPARSGNGCGNGLGGTAIGTDHEDCRDIRIATEADQLIVVRTAIGAELSASIGCGRQYRVTDALRDALGRARNESVDTENQHGVTHAHGAVGPAKAEKRGTLRHAVRGSGAGTSASSSLSGGSAIRAPDAGSRRARSPRPRPLATLCV